VQKKREENKYEVIDDNPKIDFQRLEEEVANICLLGEKS